MTNQEAIDKLTYSRQVADDEYQKEWCEALEMAINALTAIDTMQKIVDGDVDTIIAVLKGEDKE